MLIKLPIGTDDIFLLPFDLREHVTHRGLGLPVPVQPRDAAGEQLAGLLQLRFCAFTLPMRASIWARFYPINPDPNPPSDQRCRWYTGPVVPAAGSVSANGPINPSADIFCRSTSAEKSSCGPSAATAAFACASAGDTLTGNLHIRRIRQRFVDQRVELGVVKVFPPFAFGQSA